MKRYFSRLQPNFTNIYYLCPDNAFGFSSLFLPPFSMLQSTNTRFSSKNVTYIIKHVTFGA